MNKLLRRLPTSYLLALACALVALAAGASAVASALTTGPVPREQSLPAAIHEALSAPPVDGVSARIQYTNHLLEGASLAGGEGGGLASSPLLTGADGRLWISDDGRARLELQAQGADTEVLVVKRQVTIYVGSSNTVYHLTLPQDSGGEGSVGEGSSSSSSSSSSADVPSVARIEEGLAHLERHADVSGPEAGDIAGQAAYTARISPKEGGSLIGGLELSWDAVHGVPLRAAVYSSTSTAPVIELAATEVSYGPVEGGIFQLSPPEGAKVVRLGGKDEGRAPASGAAKSGGASGEGSSAGGRPHAHAVGHGITSVIVVESPAHRSGGQSSVEGAKKVQVDGQVAEELPTALGTLLTFEREGVSYVLAGALRPAGVEAVARGL